MPETPQRFTIRWTLASVVAWAGACFVLQLAAAAHGLLFTYEPSLNLQDAFWLLGFLVAGLVIALPGALTARSWISPILWLRISISGWGLSVPFELVFLIFVTLTFTLIQTLPYILSTDPMTMLYGEVNEDTRVKTTVEGSQTQAAMVAIGSFGAAIAQWARFKLKTSWLIFALLGSLFGFVAGEVLLLMLRLGLGISVTGFANYPVELVRYGIGGLVFGLGTAKPLFRSLNALRHG